MKLVPYSVFGALRLRKWCPDEEFLEEEDSWYRIIHEGIRGVEFMRSMDHPDQTRSIHLDLLDFHQDVRKEVLYAIGLPLEAGVTPDRLKELFDEPEKVRRSRRRHTDWFDFKSDGPEPYLVSCTFEEGKGLSRLSIVRADIPAPKSQEELDTPETKDQDAVRWQCLEEYEILPENILSPESPLKKVALPMETNGVFRYLIRTRPQQGIKVDWVQLEVRPTQPKDFNSVFNLQLNPPDPEGVIELEGRIHKELLFRTFIQIHLTDETHHTTQRVFVEFDQWYGKVVK